MAVFNLIEAGKFSSLKLLFTNPAPGDGMDAGATFSLDASDYDYFIVEFTAADDNRYYTFAIKNQYSAIYFYDAASAEGSGIRTRRRAFTITDSQFIARTLGYYNVSTTIYSATVSRIWGIGDI